MVLDWRGPSHLVDGLCKSLFVYFLTWYDALNLVEWDHGLLVLALGRMLLVNQSIRSGNIPTYHIIADTVAQAAEE